MNGTQSENVADESSTRGEENKSTKDTEQQKKKKKMKNIGLFGLFRFSSPQDRVIIIIGLLLAALHAAAMPVLLFVFRIAVKNFADNHHTSNYFRCLNEQNSNCSAAIYCSSADNNTNCCIYDQFDCVSNNALLHVLDFVTLYCIIIAVVVFFSGWGHSAIFHYIGDKQMFEIRKRLFRSIILQDVGWFDINDTAEITSKMTEKLDQLEGGLGECLSITFQTTISVLILIILSFYYEWHIALVLLGNWPIAILAGVFLQQLERQEGIRKDEDKNDEKLTEYAEAGAIAEEMLSAIHTVTSYGAQSIVVNRYGEALEAFRKAQQRKILVYGALYGVVTFGVIIYGAVAYWFGGWAVQELHVDFTNAVMAFICVDIGFMMVAGSATDMDNLGIAQKAAGVIFDVIDAAPIIDVTSGEGIVPPADDVSNDITFNNVTFSYPSRQHTTVLKDLSLHIQNGQTVALVGTSGSGKSTIVQLLQRFYDVDSGELLIGDYNIRELNLHWLRQHIGVVSQEPVLFATTIAENIRYGNDDVTQEEIEAAAKTANAHSYIIQLPEGYETLVGERGTQMSGGQKQRIAIARALIKNPKILLLDEATSALDTESEATVQAALDEASVGRTTIIIAHRLSTIKRADVVAVIEDGRIIEIGTQAELLAQEGRFYKLVVAQLYGDEHQLISKDEEVLLKSKSSQDPVFSGVSQALCTNQLEDIEEEGREMLDIIKISRWQYLLIAVIASFIEGSMFSLFSFVFLTVAIKSYLNPNTAVEDLYQVFIWMGCIAMTVGFTIFSKGYFFGSNGGVLVSQLRKLSLQAMLRQEIGWFDLKYNWTGALVSKLAIDASLIQNVVGNQLGIMISSSGTYICIAFLTFAHLNASAASITLVTLLPLAISPVILRSTLSLDLAESVQLSREESNQVMFEGILHIRTVKSFNLHEKLVKLYEHYLTTSKRDKKKYSIAIGIIYAIVEIIQFVTVAIMLRFGAFLVTFRDDHKLHTNFIYVFIPLLATLYASGFSKQLGHSLSNYLKARTAVKTIFALLYRIPEIDVYSNRGLIANQFRGEVCFNDVAFAYPTRYEVPILRKINFSVIPGETLAVVGSSGCGKSTVTSLLERFYDPSYGVVQLDKTDIKLFNIQWLRRQIGLVSQEPILFDATIADNIRFGANFRKVTDDEIEMAAKTADIHKFIMNLPQGYDTKVGPKGGHLSGGQKQRIAIARALVRDPKILILDEATSALDTESEKIVEEALRKAQAGRTCIKISHRISTVCNADKIIVINDGQVVESGTHAELMTLNGLYCHMNDISK